MLVEFTHSSIFHCVCVCSCAHDVREHACTCMSTCVCVSLSLCGMAVYWSQVVGRGGGGGGGGGGGESTGVRLSVCSSVCVTHLSCNLGFCIVAMR